METTAAHRVLERIADGTCTQVWIWMTNKCRRRMNGGEGYITIEISQRKEKKKKKKGKRRKRKPRERREAPRMGEELGVHIFGRGVLSPWDVGPSDSVYFSPPKQAVAPSEPNFWTHSLQIHCNGPGLKTETLHVSLLNNGKNYIQE